jgi:hypothetical protein
MKQQQAQSQAIVTASADIDVETIAIRNFEARNGRGDRAWSQDRMDPCRPALVLSERERREFIEQARHQTGPSARGRKPRQQVQ